MAWYFVLIVVAWLNINTVLDQNNVSQKLISRLELPSATNSRYTLGGVSSLGNTTMPFRTSFRRNLLSANVADWPAEQIGTGILFRSIERILVGMN